MDDLTALLDLLYFRYSPIEFGLQLWLKNYEWVICKLPVPLDMLEEIQAYKAEANISTEELVARINANEQIGEAYRDNPNIPVNLWREYIEEERPQGQFIKLKFEASEIEAFLTGRTDSVSYLLVYVVVRFLYLMREFQEGSGEEPNHIKYLRADGYTENFLHRKAVRIKMSRLGFLRRWSGTPALP